jgi:hypothetical protein
MLQFLSTTWCEVPNIYCFALILEMNEDFRFCDLKVQAVSAVRDNTVNSSSDTEQQVEKLTN